MDSVPISATPRPGRSWLVLQLGIGTCIGILALVWAVRGLDLQQVLNTLEAARYTWVLVSLICVVGVALTKAARWNALYGVTEQPGSFRDLFSVLMIAQMVNVIIPLRVGELIRIGLMKQAGRPGATTLSTIAIEKALDLVAAGLIAVSLALMAVAPQWLQAWSGSVLLMGLTLLIGLILIWYLRAWLEKVLARLLALFGWLPVVWQGRLLRICSTMLEAFGAMTELRTALRILFWTVVTWLFSLLAMLTLFSAFNLSVPFSAAVVMMLAITFSNVVPSPPALIGVIHAIAVVVLGEYGVAQPVALGFGIVLNIATVAPLVVLGSLALWQRALFSVSLLHRYSPRRLWKG